MHLTGASVIHVAKDQMSCDLVGDTVILHLNSGTYYSLNRVGSRIWQVIQEPTTLDALRDRVLAEYDVRPTRFDDDVSILIEDLAAAGLIEVRDGSIP